MSLPHGFTLFKPTRAKRWLPSMIFSLASCAAGVTWFVFKRKKKHRQQRNKEKMINLLYSPNSIEGYFTPVVATNDYWLARQ